MDFVLVLVVYCYLQFLFGFDKIDVVVGFYQQCLVFFCNKLFENFNEGICIQVVYCFDVNGLN